MRHLSFEEWLRVNPDVRDTAKCEMCNGHGKHECECGDDHRCMNCYGRGYVEEQARKIYHKQLDKEKASLVKWGVTVS